MNKIIFCVTTLIVAFPAFSGEPRINTTRDSGGYEVTLRQAGIPLSGGLAWTGHAQAPTVAVKASQLADTVSPTKTAVAKES